MAQFKWKEELSVGIAEIDEQHKSLIAATNKLDEALTAEDKAGANAVIESLASYIGEHIRSEEAYLAQHHYPNLAEHKKAHKVFIRRVLGFVSDFRNEDLVAHEVLAFLQAWIVEHIESEDAQYARYFAQQ